MLLGDAHVEHPGRKPLCQDVDPGARGHRRRDRDDLRIARGLGRQRLAEDLGIVVGALDCALACTPVTRSNLPTPWYLSAEVSAGA